MQHDQFTVGQTVFYVPAHAWGDPWHEDVEQGIVTSANADYIFVRFGTQTTSKACAAAQLITSRGRDLLF